MKHVISIRMAYASDYPLEANRSRLALTIQNCVQSLARQTDRDFMIHLMVSQDDLLLQERVTAFMSLGVPINFDRPAGRVCVTRMDDDDIIAPDFITRLKAANPVDGWYSFPYGYVRTQGGVYRRRYWVENQFLSRVCRTGESVYALEHTKVRGVKIIDERPAWVWWQHAHAQTQRNPSHCYGPPLQRLAW